MKGELIMSGPLTATMPIDFRGAHGAAAHMAAARSAGCSNALAALNGHPALFSGWESALSCRISRNSPVNVQGMSGKHPNRYS